MLHTFRFTLLLCALLSSPGAAPPLSAKTAHAASSKASASDKKTAAAAPAAPTAGPTATSPDAEASASHLWLKTPLVDYGESKILMIGDGDHRNYYIGVRSDRLVTAAQLQLHYSHSPSLLPRLSQLQIRLNQQLVANLPVRNLSDADQKIQTVIPLDPQLFAEDNWLNFQLIGHYTTQDCEDANHTSIWLDLDALNTSIQLRLSQEHLSNDLALLPNPWLDKRDRRSLQVKVVTSPTPDHTTLQAAAKLASWLGSSAEGRRVSVTYWRGTVPPGHVIVLATGDTPTLGEWTLPEVGQPTVRIVEHPQDKEAKVLLIQGKNSEELDMAVMGMVWGQSALTGAMAAFDSPLKPPPPRKPYDSPNWLVSDKPVKFGQLVRDPRSLELSGKHENAIRVQMRLAPDLWTGPGARGHVRLRYRANASDSEKQEDRLSLTVNGALIQNWRLPRAVLGHVGVWEQALPLFLKGHSDAFVESPIDHLLPGEDNRIEIALPLGIKPGGGMCSSTLQTTYASIHPDSVLDLTDLPHYKAMPDLKSFRETGYPFTRMADLSDTVVVLPDRLENAHIEALLTLMSDMGRWSGVPATAVRVVKPAQTDAFKDKDVLWISTGSLAESMGPWVKNLALINEFTGGSDVVGGQWLNWLRRLNVLDKKTQEGWIQLALSGPIAIMAGLESPWTPKRSLVLLNGSVHQSLQELIRAFTTPSQAYRIEGGLVVLRSNEIEVVDRRITYHIGRLPFLSWLGLLLGDRPVLVVVLTLLAVIGVLVYIARWLIHRSRERLARPAPPQETTP